MKPFLGIRYSDRALDTADSSPGCKTVIQVESVVDGSPAAGAGIEEKDTIVAINDRAVCGKSDSDALSLRKAIEDAEIGPMVRVDILRGGAKMSLFAALAEAPSHHMDEAEYMFPLSCQGESLLAGAFRDEGCRQLYEEVREGLHLQSDAAVNPAWFYKGLHNPLQLRVVTSVLRHPLQAGAMAAVLTEKVPGQAAGPDRQPASLLNNAAAMIDLELKLAREVREATLPNLIQGVVKAHEEVRSALKHLPPEEQSLIREQALQFQQSREWNRILRSVLTIDIGRILNAVYPLSVFLSEKNLARLKKDVETRFRGKHDEILFEQHTPAGKIIVGGRGNNVYHEDAALIIDLAGDDMYLNNAGGTRKDMHVALVIDWDGDDIYQTQEAYSQGAGFLGGGLLFDSGGRDTFSALDAGQGMGFLGLGYLFHGQGEATFLGRRYCQGVAGMGMGLLQSGTGDSVYLCGEYGQGYGLFGGAGVLLDESGNDFFRLGGLEPDFRDPDKSTVSMGQGFGTGIRPEKGVDGLAGGIGILLDMKGDDTYSADYFAQGGGYFYGLGILRDMEGNDRYLSGRYSQGAGVHTAAGVLIDQQGDDSYYAYHGVAQGMGHDYGIGFLEDRAGDDRYRGGTLVQGAATHGSIGILLDQTGSDRFTCGSQCRAFSGDSKGMGIEISGESGGGQIRLSPSGVRINRPPESRHP